MPTRPKLAAVEAGKIRFKTFDQYVEEAMDGKEPFQLPVADGDVITVQCPLGSDIIALAEAQIRQDVVAAATAIFKDDAPRILMLTGSQRFTVFARILNDVLTYYGMQGAQLPES